MCLLARNGISFFSQDGRPKSEDRCVGHFSYRTRIKMDIQSSGIIALIHNIFLPTANSCLLFDFHVYTLKGNSPTGFMLANRI
ncbi:hypothetical protein M3O96_10790 [Aquiflexum sp. TKW24L]|uniref:hypothetical protein n=1 Tax=Aquiflexum sp. TKW24L TaxID=2942212 RepID=UPI0020C12CB4|nr:hypothetical protein [Aquiflexum sp. TKW24L]MCL6259579.1 hypothetical protein [Aquiflexum sp. TKW24L]